MRAITVRDDATRSLELDTVARPSPRHGEVLIRVRAVGVNRLDWLQRHGHYPLPADASPILGLEVAGEVVELGPDAAPWQPGDRVCALLTGGGYADYAVAPAATCLPIPGDWDDAQAASLPEALFTAWSNCVDLAHLQPGESVLVHGGASGVGVYAIQLLTALGHAVYATAGGPDKCTACISLGAQACVDYRTQDFVAEFRHLLDGGGIDVILDMVGGDTTPRNLQLANLDGRILLIAFQAGRYASLDLAQLLAKRVQLIGSTLRARPLPYKAKLAAAIRQQVWPLIEQGHIRPVVHRCLPLADAEQAHALMAKHEYVGKLVLAV